MQLGYWETWQLGVGAGLVQLAAGEFAAAAYGSHTSPVRAVGKWLINAMPTPLIDAGVALLRRLDKPAIAATLVVLSVALPALASMAGTWPLVAALLLLGALGMCALWRRTELSRSAAVSIGLAAPVAGLAAVRLDFGGSALLAAALGILASAIRFLSRRYRTHNPTTLPESQDALPPPAESAALDIRGISPLITPVERFFVTDVTFPAPAVNAKRWKLTVEGLVERPLSLSLPELLALPSTEVDAVLMCVHNSVGGPFVGNARWRGVLLTELLSRAGVSPQADHIRLHAVDGFSAGISLRLLEQGFAPLLVYAMNGLPLKRRHGAPVRVLVPGIHGYDANIKWLASIELTRFDDAVDYAERKGWPRTPSRVAPNARIDVPSATAVLKPGDCVIAGVGWSPPGGVVKVELRVDGGPWRSCILASALGPSAWVHWKFHWQAPPGRHTLEVRTWGRDGVQSAEQAAPYPDGAQGYHSVPVHVTSARTARSRQLVWWTALQARARWDLAWAGVRAWRRLRP